MKKVRIACLICLLALALCSIEPVLAVLTQTSDTITNNVSHGDIAVSLEEIFDPEKASSVVPGQEIEKKPCLKNDGTIDAFLAMKVLFVSGDAAVSAQELKEQRLSLLGIDEDNWTLFEDGTEYLIYYYNDAVPPEGATTPLFETVRISSQWIEPCSFDIVLSGSAVQSRGLTGSDAANLLR